MDRTSFVELGKAGQTACGGDSGGPALVMLDGVETIVGIDSFSDAEPDCSASEFYQRVDTETAFIKQFVTASSAGTPTTPSPADAKPGTGDDEDEDETTPGSSTKQKRESTDPDEESDTPRRKSTGAADAAAGCAIGGLRGGSSGRTPALAIAAVLGLALARRRRR